MSTTNNVRSKVESLNQSNTIDEDASTPLDVAAAAWCWLLHLLEANAGAGKPELLLRTAPVQQSPIIGVGVFQVETKPAVIAYVDASHAIRVFNSTAFCHEEDKQLAALGLLYGTLVYFPTGPNALVASDNFNANNSNNVPSRQPYTDFETWASPGELHQLETLCSRLPPDLLGISHLASLEDGNSSSGDYLQKEETIFLRLLSMLLENAETVCCSQKSQLDDSKLGDASLPEETPRKQRIRLSSASLVWNTVCATCVALARCFHQIESAAQNRFLSVLLPWLIKHNAIFGEKEDLIPLILLLIIWHLPPEISIDDRTGAGHVALFLTTMHTIRETLVPWLVGTSKSFSPRSEVSVPASKGDSNQALVNNETGNSSSVLTQPSSVSGSPGSLPSEIQVLQSLNLFSDLKLSEVVLRLLLITTLALRCLDWAQTTAIENPNCPLDNARRHAVALFLEVWTFSPDDTTSTDTVKTGRGGVEESSLVLQSFRFSPVQTTICLLGGRGLIAALSGVGRIVQIGNAISETYLGPTPVLWTILTGAMDCGQYLEDVLRSIEQESSIALDRTSGAYLFIAALYLCLLRTRWDAVAEDALQTEGLHDSYERSRGPPRQNDDIDNTGGITLEPVQSRKFVTLQDRVILPTPSRPFTVMQHLLGLPGTPEVFLFLSEMTTLGRLLSAGLSQDASLTATLYQWTWTSLSTQVPCDELSRRLPHILRVLGVPRRGAPFSLTRNQKKAVELTAPTWNADFGEPADGAAKSHDLEDTSDAVNRDHKSTCLQEPQEIGEELILNVESAARFLTLANLARIRLTVLEPLLFKRYHDALAVLAEKYDLHGKMLNMPDPLEGNDLEVNDIPDWALCRIISDVWLHGEKPTFASNFLRHMIERKFPGTLSDLSLRTQPLTGPHSLLPIYMFHLCQTLSKWSDLLGPAIYLSFTLQLFQDSLAELRAEMNLVNLDLPTAVALKSLVEPPLPGNKAASNPQMPRPAVQQKLCQFYKTMSCETIAGRLLIVSGIEPQFLHAKGKTLGNSPEDASTDPAENNLWTGNAEVRRNLRLPLVGLAFLDDVCGVKEPIFTGTAALSEEVLRAIQLAYLLLVRRFPELWPEDQLLRHMHQCRVHKGRDE